MTGQSKDAGVSSPPLSARDTKRNKASLSAAYLTLFLNTLSTMTVVQATPVLMARAYKGDMSKTLITLGRLASLSAAFEVLLNPLISRWSDQAGRKSALLLTVLVSAAVRFLLSKFPNNFFFISLSRSLGATMFGVSTTITKIVASDLSEGLEPEQKKAHFTKTGMTMGGVIGLGAILGMVFGGKLTAKDATAPFRVSVALGLLAATVAALRVGDTRPPGLEGSSKKALPIAPFNFVKLFKRTTPADPTQRKAMVELHIANALQHFVASIGFDVPQAYCRARFSWEASEISRWLALSALVSVISNYILGISVRKFNERTVTTVATMASAYMAIRQATAATGRDMLAALVPNLLGGTSHLSIVAKLNQLESEGRSSDYQSSFSNLQAFLRVIAPLVYGQVFAWGIRKNVAGAPYLLNAACMTLSLLLYNRAMKKLEKK